MEKIADYYQIPSINFGPEVVKRIGEGSKVQYSIETHELVIDIPYDPKEIGSKNHELIDFDYLGNEIAQDGKALPGPFQILKKGKNKFKIWNGLPILEKGELPNPMEFTSYNQR